MVYCPNGMKPVEGAEMLKLGNLQSYVRKDEMVETYAVRKTKSVLV